MNYASEGSRSSTQENHRETTPTPSSVENCFPQNQSLVPKKVGDHSSKESTQTFSRHLHFPSLNCCPCQVSNTEFSLSILSLYSGSMTVAEKRCDWTNKDDLWFETLLFFLSALYLLWPGSLLIPLIYTNLKPLQQKFRGQALICLGVNPALPVSRSVIINKQVTSYHVPDSSIMKW